ncbi:MAG: inorganic phosphate transporter [Desulfobulbaceae bacterium]|nr:inorganic phosphate transporter [Desulfobulbaceae bacterium]
MELIILALTVLLGLYMAWNIGANDVANSMADAVGSKSISIRQAIVLAGICEFAGAVLVGSHVTDTIRKGIVNPQAISALPGLVEGEAAAILVLGMTAALLAAALWLHIATWAGMPVSTTHSIVGAVAGFGVAAAGWDCVNWGKMGQIVASWFISPVAGGVMGYVIFTFISSTILRRPKPARSAMIVAPFIAFALAMVVTLATVYKGLTHVSKGAAWASDKNTLLISLGIGVVAGIGYAVLLRVRLHGKDKLPIGKQLELVERSFAPLVVVSSCAVAFAHGSNDVANAVGPLAAVAHILTTGTIEMKVGVPPWILMLGGTGIVLGLATYGYKVMQTVGTDITEITPSRGVAADIAATATVLICTRMRLPISTTHTLVGAIMGIGLARGLSGINSGITGKIFSSWLITVPIAAFMSVVLFYLGRFFFFDLVHQMVLTAAG